MFSPDETIELDIAIIGGGSAGMALATKLNGSPATVFEPSTAAELPKTPKPQDGFDDLDVNSFSQMIVFRIFIT